MLKATNSIKMFALTASIKALEAADKLLQRALQYKQAPVKPSGLTDWLIQATGIINLSERWQCSLRLLPTPCLSQALLCSWRLPDQHSPAECSHNQKYHHTQKKKREEIKARGWMLRLLSTALCDTKHSPTKQCQQHHLPRETRSSDPGRGTACPSTNPTSGSPTHTPSQLVPLSQPWVIYADTSLGTTATFDSYAA